MGAIAEMDRIGVHSGEGARLAALRTRKPEPEGISEAELRAEWSERAGDHRFDLSRGPGTPHARTGCDRRRARPGRHGGARHLRDPRRGARHGPRRPPGRIPLDDILTRADEFMASGQAVAVGEERWTTPEMLDLEGRVVALAAGPLRADYRARTEAVTAALASRPSLSAEQGMAEQLTLSGRPVEVVIGHPGTGKTFTLDAVREAFETSGHRVIGVSSLAARAARELQAGSGIISTTAHALQAAIDLAGQPEQKRRPRGR